MAKRGRPPSFDKDEALEAAMRLFWANGYDGTTLEDLLDVMGGITPPSLYHAFGAKEDLFKSAIDLYVGRVGGAGMTALNQAKTARQGVEAMLRVTAEALTKPGGPKGCMLVLSATKCSKDGEGAQDYVHAIRLKAPDAIRKRVRRGVEEGDVPRAADAHAMGAFYATVLHGIGVRAGDGVSRAELTSAIDGAMAAWDTMAVGRSRRRKA